MNGIYDMTNGVNIAEYSDQSKIWIYASSRKLNQGDLSLIVDSLDHFTAQWTAHDESLRAKGWMESERFLILMVDEQKTSASGCSIDSSVRFLKTLGEKLTIDWFDRMTFYYEDSQGQIQSVKRGELTDLYQSNIIDDETLFFNLLVKNKLEFNANWKVPFRQSWQYKMM